MRRYIWVPIAIVAVVVSIALGMRIGGGGKKPPTRPPQTGSNGAGSSLPSNGGSTDQTATGTGNDDTDPNDKDKQPQRIAIAFTLDPADPETGTPVTLKDETEVDDTNSIILSEWRIEGPGLTVPATVEGNEAEFTFPKEGMYRVAHRLQLKDGGLSDWLTQVVIVAKGPEQAAEEEEAGPRLETLIISDATSAIDLWEEDGQLRFRINSAALDEPKSGLVEQLKAKVTFVGGESSSFGPGSFRMDIPLGLGVQTSAVSTFSVSGTLPSGRELDQSFNVRQQ